MKNKFFLYFFPQKVPKALALSSSMQKNMIRSLKVSAIDLQLLPFRSFSHHIFLGFRRERAIIGTL